MRADHVKRGLAVTHKFGWSGTVVTGNFRQSDGRVLVKPDAVHNDPPMWVDPGMLSLPVCKDVAFGVTTSAMVMAPEGSVISTVGGNPAITLPCGRLLKFWVMAELVDDATGVYQNLSTETLGVMGVALEPGDGAVVGG